MIDVGMIAPRSPLRLSLAASAGRRMLLCGVGEQVRGITMPRIAYVNGAYVPLRDAAVSIEDRGYQFADGV